MSKSESGLEPSGSETKSRRKMEFGFMFVVEISYFDQRMNVSKQHGFAQPETYFMRMSQRSFGWEKTLQTFLY